MRICLLHCFAAGNEKFAHYSASVGVHGASDLSGNETTTTGAATVSMARIVKQLGVPPSIIGKMVVTPPNQMVWLTPDELKSMGTSMMGKPAQLEHSNPPAQLPQDISPKTQASAPTWNTLVDKVVRLSSSQNNGKVDSSRVCQPEHKTCINAVFYKSGEKHMFLKVTRDLSEKIIRREVCELNSYGDIRTCVDWDNNTTQKDMKNSKGIWIGVD